MNIYGDTFATGRNARFLNFLLIVAGIALFAWTVSIWMEPAVVPYHTAARRAKAPSHSGVRRLSGRSSYNIIVNNDIFRASRKRYVAPPKPVAIRGTVRTIQPAQLPSLTLLGTVILDKSKAAIISLRGRENEAEFYKVGDTIGEFTIKKILKDSVLLKSGTQVLEVPLNRPNDAKGWNARGGSTRPYGR